MEAHLRAVFHNFALIKESRGKFCTYIVLVCKTGDAKPRKSPNLLLKGKIRLIFTRELVKHKERECAFRNRNHHSRPLSMKSREALMTSMEDMEFCVINSRGTLYKSNDSGSSSQQLTT